MRTMEVLIEQNALGTTRPMELAAQAPVSALVPAIVEELQLPQTDLFGNRLVYLLRNPSSGQVLPQQSSLEAVGVSAGAKLALDSYVMEGSVATLASHMQGQSDSQPLQSLQPAFYSSDTQADAAALPALGIHTSASMPAVRSRKKGRWTRRAFLALGGIALGAGTAGVGYAAYRSFLMNGAGKAISPALTQSMQPQHKTTATMAALPTSAQSMLVFSQHTQTVRALAWSHDGTMLASGANDHLLLTWDTNGAVQVRQEQAGIVHAVAWSPDGAQVVAAAMNRITWLNAKTGGQLAQSRHTHQGTVTTLAWSSQQPSLLVSGATDKKAVVWNTAGFTPQLTFIRHTAAIEAATWAADNSTIATSSSGGVIRVWNAMSGQEVHPLYQDAPIPMRASAWNLANNQLAVGGDDGIVRLWNGMVCRQVGQNQCADVPMHLQAHNGIVRALGWSPDGRLLATGGDDGTLAVWSPAQGQMPLLRVMHGAPVLALAWSPDGKRIVTASGNTATIWGLQ